MNFLGWGMTVTCNYPKDMSILEEKLIDVLTDITISKCTPDEVDALVEYLENNKCEYFK